MTKLQAALKDKSAKNWRSRKVYYKVGSYFKGCRNCGEVELVETKSGNSVERYVSGHDVFRSYDPKFVGWTWWCYTCGAKDLKCWAPDSAGMVEAELGKPPMMGSREVKYQAKKAMRRELCEAAPRQEKVSNDPEILRIQAEIERLKQLIEKGVVV